MPRDLFFYLAITRLFRFVYDASEVDATSAAREEDVTTDEKTTAEGETDETDPAVLGESAVEGESNVSDERERPDGIRSERLETIYSTEEAGEKKCAKIDYLEIQTKIILSDDERKAMWDEYRHYVDETVFVELQDAIMCRYIIIL